MGGVEQSFCSTYAPLEDILAKSNYISIHVAYTKDTYHLIGEREIGFMNERSYIINTARGAIIDEKALVRALKERKIGGAGLDVFEHEPQLEPELYGLKNVVLSPHLGSATVNTRTKMGKIAVENLLEVLEGRMPSNLVNREVFESIV